MIWKDGGGEGRGVLVVWVTDKNRYKSATRCTFTCKHTAFSIFINFGHSWIYPVETFEGGGELPWSTDSKYTNYLCTLNKTLICHMETYTLPNMIYIRGVTLKKQ